MAKAEQDKARTFFKEVRQREPNPVYLFHGEERYLIERAIAAVTARVMGPGEVESYRVHRMRGSENTGREVVESVRTTAMFGDAQLVVLRELDKMDEKGREAIAEYTKAPSRKNVLILTAAKLDARKASWKTIKKESNEVCFQPLYRDQMASWIQRQGKLRNITISGPAADYLAEAVGTDMSLVDGAIEKLSLLSEDGRVGVEQAQECVADTRERTIFELTDALSKRDLGDAMSAIRSLEEHGNDPIPLLMPIARHVRILLKIKSGQKRGLNDSQLATFVGVHGFFLKGYLAGARRFQTRELIALHKMVFEADRTLKSSRFPGDVVIQRLLFAFCLGVQV